MFIFTYGNYVFIIIISIYHYKILWVRYLVILFPFLNFAFIKNVILLPFLKSFNHHISWFKNMPFSVRFANSFCYRRKKIKNNICLVRIKLIKNNLKAYFLTNTRIIPHLIHPMNPFICYPLIPINNRASHVNISGIITT